MSKSLLETLYRSPFGRMMSILGDFIAQVHQPFMVYGYFDQNSNQFHKYTRISSSAIIINKKHISFGDQVWVWHYSILDATEGLVIEEGCQIGAWVGIFTHGSENSIRLLGKQFVHISNTERKGYSRGSVRIGAYTFIGAGSVVLPGVQIGKGCLIGSGTLVTKNIPDYSIVVGSPGQVKGSTIDLDAKFFLEQDFSDTYYDQDALTLIFEKISMNIEKRNNE